MLGFISGLFSFASAPVKAWQERKTLKATQEHEVIVLKHKARVEHLRTGQSQDYDLDRVAMENMNKSWKDELILIIFLTPLIMAFFPQTAADALEGFKVIESMPKWYTAIIIGMVVVIYGMRGMLRAYFAKRLK
ncbi:MAG: hypothetical protein ISEC1_P1930 [Thiomicrorhabdus sp.]|nr:MAG: hypothetical protein ISEC1_P1930 [Thiomicrorhabdus sp.]